MILSSDNRRERLLRILSLKRRSTIDELAKELGVSERTIMRDIVLLSSEKPIFTMPGKNGGVYIDTHYVSTRLHMKKHETDLLNKIVSDIENYSYCSLSESELSTLKEIVAMYSNKHTERKKMK